MQEKDVITQFIEKEDRMFDFLDNAVDLAKRRVRHNISRSCYIGTYDLGETLTVRYIKTNSYLLVQAAILDLKKYNFEVKMHIDHFYCRYKIMRNNEPDLKDSDVTYESLVGYPTKEDRSQICLPNFRSQTIAVNNNERVQKISEINNILESAKKAPEFGPLDYFLPVVNIV